MRKNKAKKLPRYRVVPATYGGYIPQYYKDGAWYAYLAMRGQGKVLCTSETIAWEYIKAVTRGKRHRGRKK